MPEIAGKVADGFAEAVRENEERWLSPLAVRSYETRGREQPEEECGLRTPFQRDRDRIVHSKAFRRLRFKTQVFVDPEGDHFRTRLTHTLEAAGIARGVARGLRLNEDLTEAIAVGHDLGHPPFGHAGEQALDEILRERGAAGFRHNEHSLRVVERLERDGRGLNLTWETRDGILKHTGPVEPETQEGRIVRIVDRFAYINHDIDDALRAGLLEPADLPAEPSSSSAIRARAASTRSSTISSRRPPSPATSSRADASARRCSTCGASCSSASTSSRITRRRGATVRRIFEELVDERGMSSRTRPTTLRG